MKIRPPKTALVCRPMRQMSERIGEVPLPVPVPEPVDAAWGTGAAQADRPPPPRCQARPKAKPKRQALTRVSAERGTCRSTENAGSFNPVLTGAMRERLLALAIAPRLIRQAEAFVSDWNAQEKVLLDGKPVEVVRGRALAACAIPRTPESRWNLHALQDLEALLDEADRWADFAQDAPQAMSRSSSACLDGNRAMRIREVRAWDLAFACMKEAASYA